ncbi:DJ-1/PfpI family protein [Lentzea sp. NPDC055074]
MILPDSTVNPDRLRVNSDAMGSVREFVGSGEPVGPLCHGSWTSAEADLVRGSTLTSPRSSKNSPKAANAPHPALNRTVHRGERT